MVKTIILHWNLGQDTMLIKQSKIIIKSLDFKLEPYYSNWSQLSFFIWKLEPVKEESLVLVSTSKLKTKTLGPVLVLCKILELVSDEKFWDSLVLVSSCLLQFYSVSSQSRPDLD